MRVFLLVLLACAVTVAGCARKTAPGPAGAGSPRSGTGPVWAPLLATNQGLIVTPENVLVGKVALVDATARCVVLNFPLGKMAALEQRLNLYRRGLKVGEVKVTGPQREDNIVADLVAGEAEVGDEARSQ